MLAVLLSDVRVDFLGRGRTTIVGEGGETKPGCRGAEIEGGVGGETAAAADPFENVAPAEGAGVVEARVGVGGAHYARATLCGEFAREDVFEAVQKFARDGAVAGSDSHRAVFVKHGLVLVEEA
ncbi:hypothetical protein V501_09127, partial [Pseudogymnoascus sp. VKM F-4519 (FW-2642)]